MGMDMQNSLAVIADMENSNGGLLIGQDRYNVQFITYDTQNLQSMEVSAANRLIFQDNVKYILGAEGFEDALLSITEPNKILYLARSPSPALLSTNLHYTFQAGFINEMTAAFFGWFSNKYPDKKTVIMAFPDNQLGHLVGDMFPPIAQVYGVTLTDIFYPPTATDLSSVGTKVKVANPDAFMASCGNDPLAYKAAYEAGYRGMLCNGSTMTASTLLSIMPADEAEGFFNSAWPVEFDTQPTQLSKDFKAAYIAKYGKWESPEIVNTAMWYCLKAALQKSGSLETDKLADVISNGLKFEGPTGPAQMVSRPDIGNNRTIDSVVGLFIKQIVGGKVTSMDTVSLENAVSYFNQYLSAQSASNASAK